MNPQGAGDNDDADLCIVPRALERRQKLIDDLHAQCIDGRSIQQNFGDAVDDLVFDELFKHLITLDAGAENYKPEILDRGHEDIPRIGRGSAYGADAPLLRPIVKVR